MKLKEANISGNELPMPSELKARELLFQMQLAIEQGETKELQANFCFNVMMNTILQEIKDDPYWRSVMMHGKLPN